MHWFDPHMNYPQPLAEVELLIQEFAGIIKGYYLQGCWYDSRHMRVEPVRWRYGQQWEGVVEYREASEAIEWIIRQGGEF